MKGRFLVSAACAVLMAAALAGCEAQKSANPLSPSVAGPIPGVEISAPRMLEPGQGARYRESQQPINLRVENATSNGVRPLYYTFEVASDTEFQTKMFARSQVLPGENGRTSVTVDRLELGRGYYWRVRAEDGANTGPFVSAQFEVLPRPELGPPALISPVNNQQTSTRRPILTIGRSSRNSAVGAVSYEFHVALDPAFGLLAATGVVAEEDGQTSFTPPGDLGVNQQHYWRARAGDGETTGPWSETQGFRTPAAAPAPSPGPAPGPGGSCGPPFPGSPEAIVQCQRSKYGFMGASEIVAFLRAVARDLNAAGISGGPFGILLKDSGHNCHGYSCDIICAGNGGGQRQWDVLGDVDGAQTPAWIGPLSTIVVRPCEIQ